jgi:hypothetical protein
MNEIKAEIKCLNRRTPSFDQSFGWLNNEPHRTRRKAVMFKRTVIFSLAAATVAVAAVATSNVADARPGFDNGPGVRGGSPVVARPNIPGRHVNVRPGIQVRPGLTPRPIQIRPRPIVLRPGAPGRPNIRPMRCVLQPWTCRRPPVIVRPHRCITHPWLCRPIARPHFCWRHPERCARPIPTIVRYPVGVPVAAPVAAAPVVMPVRATPAAPTASGPCTCLRKTYLPNGAVLFEDVCTNESAVNPPQHAAEAPQQQQQQQQ